MTVPESTDCPFCNMRSQPGRVLSASKEISILLSNPRLMPGHTLIVPNRHIEKPWGLTKTEVWAIFEAISSVEKTLLESGLATGCDIRQNYRPFIPQGRVKVNHVHFHVLPRTSEDELYKVSMQFETQLFQDLPKAEATEMKQLFRDILQSS